ncbi:hypothetical protein MRX96_055949 [Rhipicephalus microplus]
MRTARDFCRTSHFFFLVRVIVHDSVNHNAQGARVSSGEAAHHFVVKAKLRGGAVCFNAPRTQQRVKLYSTVPAKRTKLRAHGCNIAHLSLVSQPDSLLHDGGKSYGGEFVETVFEKNVPVFRSSRVKCGRVKSGCIWTYLAFETSLACAL